MCGTSALLENCKHVLASSRLLRRDLELKDTRAIVMRIGLHKIMQQNHKNTLSVRRCSKHSDCVPCLNRCPIRRLNLLVCLLAYLQTYLPTFIRSNRDMRLACYHPVKPGHEYWLFGLWRASALRPFRSNRDMKNWPFPMRL